MNATLEAELNEVVEKYRGKHDWMSFDEKSEHDVMFKKFLHSIYEVRALRRESTDLKEQLMVYDTLGEHFERLRMDYQVRACNALGSAAPTNGQVLMVLFGGDRFLRS